MCKAKDVSERDP